MRRIFVDHARRKRSLKRGGEFERVGLDAVEATGVIPVEDILAISDALEKLAEYVPGEAELVKLGYFGGFSIGRAQCSCLTHR
jgi:hypothetical protein